MSALTIEELKSAGLLKKAKDITAKFKRNEPTSIKEIFPEGEFIDTPYKSVFKITNTFSKEENIGNIRIKDFFKFRDNFTDIFKLLSGNELLKKFKLNNMLFFDVESTGLSTGAGNMVFLIGLGFFEKENFTITQYFIEDYINEKGLLYILEQEFKKRSHLISFNGRSFDFYVLKNRFILSRKFEFSLNNLLHFDLLHSSRRIWKNMFSDYSLINLEKEVLKFHRTSDDIPGYLIPIYYKEYIRTGNPDKMSNIIYHNLIDVKSMLGLLITQLNIINDIYKNKLTHKINYFSVASLFKDINNDKYKDLLTYNIEKGSLDIFNSFKAAVKLHKKEKDYESLKQTLNRMFNIFPDDIFPYIEALKYYEHIEKNYDEALNLIKKIENLNFYANLNDSEVDDIIKRKDRLIKKCSKE